MHSNPYRKGIYRAVVFNIDERNVLSLFLLYLRGTDPEHSEDHSLHSQMVMDNMFQRKIRNPSGW